MRSFIAVELPENVRRALVQAGEALSGRLDSKKAVRWIPRANLHLTLRFLGDTSADQQEAIKKGLEEITRKTAGLDLYLGKLGCFPNQSKPRIIWVDLVGNLRELNSLQQEIESLISTIGWPPESRRFHPHITIGRVKESRLVVSANFPWNLALDPLPVPVSHISLMKSDLLPTGAVYMVRYRSQLTG